MHTHSVSSDRRAFAGLAIGLFALSLLAACASGGDKNDLSKRLEQNGYSFMPPSQSGWFVASRSDDKVTLAKAGRMEGETYLLEGTPLKLDGVADPAALTDFAADLHRTLLPAPRFRIRENDTSEIRIDDAQCVLTHIVAEDRDPETGSNVLTAMLVDTVSMVCMHPTSPDLGIGLTFTHRSFPEDEDKAFKSYAESILNTVQFSPVDATTAN